MFVDLEAEIRGKMRNIGQGRWTCKVCNYESKSTNVYNHVEVRHLHHPMVYTCGVCAKNYKSRNSYNVHVSMYHKHQA